MKVIKLKVKGMTCKHCVETVTSGLKNKNGISATKVDLDTKSVEVNYDENIVTKENIIETLGKLGYQAQE